RCDPENAWVAGLLAPLGWLAVAAVGPQETAAVLADPELARVPATVQQRMWHHEQNGIARRLARRWRLPGWLAAIVGHLSLPLETALSLGADGPLFRVTQLAVGMAQQREVALNLAVGTTPEANAAALRLETSALEELTHPLDAEPSPGPAPPALLPLATPL